MKGGPEVLQLCEHRRAGLTDLALWTRFLAAGYRDVGAMAGRAVLGSGFIEENRLVGYDFGQFVTVGAPDVLVGTAQGEGGPLLVIKQRGPPFRAVVAVGAGGSFPFGKLLSVNVLVAVLAKGWGRLEIHVDQLGFEVWRFVAVDAGRRPVCPEQGELGLGMVEGGQLPPGLGVVAGLATGWCLIGPELLHALLELALMGIVMATGTVQVLPAIDRGRFGLKLG